MRKEAFAYLSCATTYVSLMRSQSFYATHPTVEALSDFTFRCATFGSPLFHPNHRITVLFIIQEKLNNPSPDDPYEPEIAAVSLEISIFPCFADCRSPASEERQEQVFGHGQGMDEEVSYFVPYILSS